MFRKVKKVHFIGIGGSGMCGLAEVLLNMGYDITGSDIAISENTERLEQLGVRVWYGHSASNVDDVDLVVVSSALRGDNPELIAAAERNIPVLPRAELLAELMRLKVGIAVAGSHGKSTTTSLIGEILSVAGLDPTIIVGGRVVSLRANARLGAGKYLVAEADEFDRSFLRLLPTIIVVTNIEPDHLECYENDFELLKSAFLDFMGRIPFYGALFVCADDPVSVGLLPELSGRVFTYGLSSQAMVRAVRASFNHLGTSFSLVVEGEDMGVVQMGLIGLHNIRNALASISVALELGIPLTVIKEALANFAGVCRRFQVRGEMAGVMVIDDYAHHYTELAVTLRSARLAYPSRRLIAVFQPHLFSRTATFYREFGKALLESDVAIVTDIYPSREEAIEGISGELVADAAREYGHSEVYYRKELDTLHEFVREIAKPGDIVITLGAGDIWRVGVKLMEVLKHQSPPSCAGRAEECNNEVLGKRV